MPILVQQQRVSNFALTVDFECLFHIPANAGVIPLTPSTLRSFRILCVPWHPPPYNGAPREFVVEYPILKVIMMFEEQKDIVDCAGVAYLCHIELLDPIIRLTKIFQG